MQGAPFGQALPEGGQSPTASSSKSLSPKRRRNIENHPCYAQGCHGRSARIHLAVAPRCNIACNFCVRDFDCPNESRPGVTSTVLSPEQACARFLVAREELGNLAVVGIAGPGDPLANWPSVRRTFELIRAQDDDVAFCLSTNGLRLPRYAAEIVELGISHVTVTVNAVDARVGARVYGHVLDLDDARALSGEEGASLLLRNQLEGIRLLADAGVMVKVNTVLIDGVNVEHVGEIARVVAELGAACHNINAMIPVKGAVFEALSVVSRQTLVAAREQSERHLPQIRHCRQCRADAVGELGCDVSARIDELVASFEAALAEAEPAEEGPALGQAPESGFAQGGEADAGDASASFVVAVATESGIRVDAHFGHAQRFHIYDLSAGGPRFREAREANPFCHGRTGCGDYEGDVFEVLDDCDAIVCSWAGPGPRSSLEEHGIRLFDGSQPESELMADACAGGSVELALQEAYRLLCQPASARAGAHGSA